MDRSSGMHREIHLEVQLNLGHLKGCVLKPLIVLKFPKTTW